MNRVAASAAVTARLQTIVSTSKVYNMVGDAQTEANFKNRYVTGQKIHAYEVTCEGSVGKDEQASAMARTYEVVIYGYYSFQDGISEPIFQNEIGAIEDAFDPMQQRTFDGEFDWAGPLQVVGPKLARLGNAVVHVVRMTFPVRFYPVL